MKVMHETHAVCGSAGARELTLEYLCRYDLVHRIKPVVAIIPGGGWMSGGMESVTSPLDVAPYLDAGFMVAGLRYQPITQEPFPACRDDLRTALDWLITNADDLCIRRDAIALDGGSAGGHLATLTAALEAKLRHPHPVKAVILRGPPVDIGVWFEEIQQDEELSRCVRLLLGGTPQERPELCRVASPITHIDPNMPPFLIFHGEKDTAVPLSQSELLAGCLEKVGIEVTRIIVENGTHGLDSSDERGASPTLEEIFGMKVTFLRQHLPGV